MVKNCYKKEEEPKLLLTQQKKRKTKKPLFLYVFKAESERALIQSPQGVSPFVGQFTQPTQGISPFVNLLNAPSLLLCVFKYYFCFFEIYRTL